MQQNDSDRLRAIHRFLNLEIDKDGELQEITELAADLLECPVAMITRMEGDVQCVLYEEGTDVKQTPKSDTFCQYLDQGTGLMVITDALSDQRFAGKTNIGGIPGIRFYAGASLNTHDGQKLGSLCVMDTQPKDLSGGQQHLLKVLAKRVVQIIEFEFSVNLLKEQFLNANEAEIKLKSFYESSEACHLIIGNEMQILDYNQHMVDLLWRMYGVKLVHGTAIDQLLPVDAHEEFVTNFNLALGGEPVRFQKEAVHQSGEKFWWYNTYQPCYNVEGKVVCVSYNATDVTEHRINKELIVAQQKSLLQIAYMQSHELRKPVATILGLIEIVKLECGDAYPVEIKMLEDTALELDEKVRMIVDMIV